MRNTFFYPLPYGMVRISGPNRTAFLQRQVSNDMEQLQPGSALPAALTAPTGKIIDLFLLLDRGEVVDAICLAGKTAETIRYLKSRVFFMDKVTVEPRNELELFLCLWGEELEPSLSESGLPSLLTPGGYLDFKLAGEPALMINPTVGILPGAMLGTMQNAFTVLEKAGFHLAAPEQYEHQRMEACLPGIPELNGEYTPYELRLESIISTTKGCYTGQEVLARQVTYDKITKKLCGLTIDGEAPAAAKVYAGAAPVGEITSSSGNTALAVLRRPYFEPGTKVSVRWHDSQAIGVVV